MRVDPDRLLMRVVRVLGKTIKSADKALPRGADPADVMMKIHAQKEIVKIGDLLLRISARLSPVPTEKDLTKMSDEQLAAEAAKLEAAK